MGIDIDSRFLVGLPYKDLEMWIDSHVNDVENIREFLEYSGLTEASPYYDADIKDCFFGVEVNDGMLVNDVVVELKIAETYFKNITGLDGVVYAGKHVW